jgi:hypothetical protein
VAGRGWKGMQDKSKGGGVVSKGRERGQPVANQHNYERK